MFDISTKIFKTKFQLLTLIIFSVAASAQTPGEIKKMFAQAESYFLYEEYELANPLYLTIAAYIPDNYNLLYKIGNCYLNIPDEKSKAIEFLEKAAKNSSYEAESESLKEKRAPLDSYFSLAKAYMINNELEKAQSTLQTFKKLAEETRQKGGMKNLEFIGLQIQSCNNAIKFEASPILLSKTKLEGEFNQSSVSDNPAVSFDGNTIAYTERRGVTNAIFFSKKERGKWQAPIEITNEIKAGDDCSTCSLNKDGTQLFLYKKDNFDGNIYSSNYVDGAWTPIIKLNKNINTKFYESHASISADGKKLYFTSNRDGGQGGLDIYVSEKDENGDWGVAKNVGAAINTAYNEDTPFTTLNDSVLYFSSEGHNTMGGFDVFKSQKLGDVWKTPQNLGYPINTTDDDKFFQPVNNGANAYYSMSTDYKKREIFYLGIGVSAIVQTFEIKGSFGLSDTVVNFDENFKIRLVDKASGDTLDVGSPNKSTGLYYFTAKQGNYKIIYTGEGYLSHSIDTALLPDNPSLVVNLDVKLNRDPNYVKKTVLPVQPVVFEKINMAEIPTISSVDTTMLIKNMKVNDVTDKNVKDSDVLYFTVQVIALKNPVNVSYFKYISDLKIMYNDQDKFYRYTTGRFSTKDEAGARRLELIKKGYPEEIFIKKVSK
jgi:hypothetical protein